LSKGEFVAPLLAGSIHHHRALCRLFSLVQKLHQSIASRRPGLGQPGQQRRDKIVGRAFAARNNNDLRNANITKALLARRVGTTSIGPDDTLPKHPDNPIPPVAKMAKTPEISVFQRIFNILPKCPKHCLAFMKTGFIMPSLY